MAWARLLRITLLLLCSGVLPAAHAVTYTFPGSLPAGCSGSNGSYTCGALTLGNGDVVNIGTPKPATITVNGALSTSNASFNAGGAASDLSLVVTGTLTVAYGASLTANVTAGTVADNDGYVVYGGNLAISSGTLRLGYTTSVAGNVSSTSGAITLAQSNTVGGSVTSTSGNLDIGYQSVVTGAASSAGTITLGQDARVNGGISGSTGAISVGYGARVTGAVTSSSGTIALGQNAVVSACVRSTSSAAITLGYASAANSVCCGNSCGTSCVANNSNAAMPPACTPSTPASTLHHLEIRHASGSGVTCTPSTLTVAACQDASCATAYTGGVSGTLTASGAGMSVNWPAAATFTIASGSSSVTKSVQVTTAGSVVFGASGLSPVANNATTCNFGSPSCTFTAADSGFVFDVPDHRAEVSNSVTVSAVRKSDNAASCTPAFASTSKAVTFRCSYVNPTSGTLPVRVGGSPANAANSTAAACDASGRAVTLAFNASGVATTTVQYADVGRMTLSATYTGSGSEAGLVMNGSDSFTAAPYGFAVGSITAGTLVAGNTFAASVTAQNFAGGTAPNFGRETSPEGVTLGFARTQPTGTGASNGSFSGTAGSFSGGTATASALRWSEVGRGDVSAVLTSASYLATGMTASGSSNGAVSCAGEGGTCVLPAGAVATVIYGMNGWVAMRSGQSGSVGCNNSVFGDPLYGTVKACSYVVTGGAAPGATGAAGPFKPHHFDVAVTPACSATFSYAGQPFTATLTARNAANATTVNYDGSTATSPNFARLTTLSEAVVLGLGSLGGNSVAASAFATGVARPTPSYAFTSKQTAPQTLVLRATDADAVSSTGYAEGSTPLRSGRLRLSSAFGSERSALAMAVQAQYWSGASWTLNSADSCTVVPAAAVARGAYLDARGATTTAWTTTPAAITLSAGNGSLSLSAPGSGLTGSVDIALNLGSSTSDASCLATTRPATTGAVLPWLRTQQGSCSTAWDRDPSARATFGVYQAETRRAVHVRELY